MRTKGWRRFARRDLVSRRSAAGLFLLLIGGWAMLFGIPDPRQWHRSTSAFRFDPLAELRPGMAGFPSLDTLFPIERLTRYRVVSGGDAEPFVLSVAHYHDNAGNPRSAILYAPLAEPSSTVAPSDDAALPFTIEAWRHDLWQAAAQAIREHTDDSALFLAWWDDGARVRLLTGREVWSDRPVAEMFPNPEERRFWEEVVGFTEDGPVADWARLLSTDGDQALAELRTLVPSGRSIYILVTTDILARQAEIAALSGRSLPVEIKVFPASGDIHGTARRVQVWANNDSYLVQQWPDQQVRAFRLTDPAAQNMLLVRLLPFTSPCGRRPKSGVSLPD